MSRLIWLVVALEFLCAAAPARGEWRQAESAHFILRADMPEPEIGRLASELAAFDELLRTVTGIAAPKLAQKIQILVFPDVKTARKLTGREGYQGGLTFGTAFGPLALVSATASEEENFTLREVLFHEYAHGFMMANMDEIQPLWFAEGFASLFESVDMAATGQVRYGRNPAKAQYLQTLGLVRLSDLIAADMLVDTDEGPAPAQLYASGWLLVRELYFGGARSTELAAFLKDYRAGVAGSDNAARYFAGGLEGFDKDMLALAGERIAEERHVAITSPTANAPTVRLMRPSESELWQLAARPPVLRATDAAMFETLRAHFERLDAILTKYPEEIEFAPLAAHFGLLVEAYDRVVTTADRLLAVKPGDPDLVAIKGIALTEIAVAGAEADFDRALAKGRALLDQAIKQDPDNALALMGLYRSTTAAEGATIKATAYLRRVVELEPSNEVAREALMEMYLRNGDGKNALLLMLPITNSPQESEARILARARVKALKAGKAPEAVMTIRLVRTPR